MQRPPQGVKLVMEAVCIMKGIKPKRVPGEKPGTKVDDYWEVGKGQLQDPGKFLESLFNFDKVRLLASTVIAKSLFVQYMLSLVLLTNIILVSFRFYSVPKVLKNVSVQFRFGYFLFGRCINFLLTIILQENIPESVISLVQPYIDNEEFQPANIAKVSKACTSICQWVRAMHIYHFVSRGVEVKRVRTEIHI